MNLDINNINYRNFHKFLQDIRFKCYKNLGRSPHIDPQASYFHQSVNKIVIENRLNDHPHFQDRLKEMTHISPDAPSFITKIEALNASLNGKLFSSYNSWLNMHVDFDDIDYFEYILSCAEEHRNQNVEPKWCCWYFTRRRS